MLRALGRFSLLAAALLLPGPVRAQEPAFLVEDINPTIREGLSSNPSDFTRAGERIYFVANGRLWVLDGPDAEPRRIEAVEFVPELLFAFGDRLLFPEGAGLWISDGTEAGTEKLAAIQRPFGFAVLGGLAYFLTWEVPGGYALWRTDGTAEGTQRVALLDVQPGQGTPGNLLRFGDELFFFVNGADGLTSNADLWASDGTAIGTRIVKSFSGPCCLPLARGMAVSGELLYLALGGAGFELWKSDGTSAGTELLLPLAGGPADLSPAPLADAEGTLFFAAGDGDGAQLWRTDGTLGNTVQITEFAANPQRDIDHVVALGTGAFFRVRDAGIALWYSDGTPAGTLMIGPYAALGLVAFEDHVFFGGGNLRRSDGTVAGTVAIAAGFDEPIGNLLPDEWGVYFATAQDLTGEGIEPWVTDPWFGGPKLVADLAPPQPNGLCGGYWVCSTALGALGDRVLFTATAGDFEVDWWQSDGTSAGTFPVSEDEGTLLGRLGDALFFAKGELWRTDGTAGGTFQVKDVRPGPASSFPSGSFPALGDAAFFSANDGTHGRELWRTDGSEAGTLLVKDVWPGLGESEPARFFAWGDRLVFTADDGVSGREPWLSDGTEEGTSLLLDIVPGPGSSDPERYNALGDVLLFAARDAQGVELWRSDGTGGGTARVADLWPGPDSSSPTLLRPLGARMVFAARDPDHGQELWASDGTAPGTASLADLWPGTTGSEPRELVVAGNRVYFTAGTPEGRGLGVTDGLPGGTAFVLPPGDPASPGEPGRLFPIGSKLLFTAGAESIPEIFGLVSRSIWISDGTPEGTLPLAEVSIPFGIGSGEDVFEVAGDYVFFSGYDPVHGGELWALPLAAVVPEPGAGALGAVAALALAGLRRATSGSGSGPRSPSGRRGSRLRRPSPAR